MLRYEMPYSVLQNLPLSSNCSRTIAILLFKEGCIQQLLYLQTAEPCFISELSNTVILGNSLSWIPLVFVWTQLRNLGPCSGDYLYSGQSVNMYLIWSNAELLSKEEMDLSMHLKISWTESVGYIYVYNRQKNLAPIL